MSAGSGTEFTLLGCTLMLLAACTSPTPTSVADDPATAAAQAAPTEPRSPTEKAPRFPTEQPELGPMRVLQAGDPVLIRQIEMRTLSEGWVIGGEGGWILHSQDGGLTWQEATPPDLLAAETSAVVAHFEGASHAWVHYPGSDMVWRTTNAGASWIPAKVGYENAFRAQITFDSEQRGWLMQSVESGMGSELVALFRTVDAGETWEEIIDPYASEDLQSCIKTGIAFFGPIPAWATFDCQGTYAEAFLDISRDLGNTWEGSILPLPPGAAESPEAGYCRSRSPVPMWAALVVECLILDGETLVQKAFLYRTIDGGQTWQIHSFPGGDPQFMDGMTIYTMNRGLFLSVDGGQSWEQRKTLNWDGQFSFVGMESGWAVATNEGEIAFVNTVDGGRTWAVIQPQIAPDSN